MLLVNVTDSYPGDTHADVSKQTRVFQVSGFERVPLGGNLKSLSHDCLMYIANNLAIYYRQFIEIAVYRATG